MEEKRQRQRTQADEFEYTLPQWSWPNMTSVEKTALQDYMDALLVHEQGHIEVAERFAKDFSQSKTISTNGATPARAEADLKKQALDELNKRRQELEQDEKNYDEKTEHGGQQSKGPEWGYPSGKDVVLECP
jgi:predicted secreted Zn-dependent protease